MADVAVVDASPLILLTRVDQLSLLQLAGSRLLVPRAVVAEYMAKELDTAAAVRRFEALGFEIAPDPVVPHSVAAWDLGAGETSVLAVATQRSDVIAVVDDRLARRCATTIGIPTIGTIGLVVRARRAGRHARARPLIEQLRSSGMFVSESLLTRVFELLQE